MPNNTLEKWEEKTIDEIAYIKGGKRLPKGEKLTTEKTSHPYIRVTDFNDFGTIDVDNVQFITDNIYEQIKNYTITSKDLYISIAGTIGKSGIIPKELDGANLTENACKLVYKSNEIFNKYIYYYTKTRMFAEQIFDKTKMAAMPKLALTRLATVKLPIPPLSEQQRIVGLLDEAFENIEKAKQNTLQNLNNAKELFESKLNKIFTKNTEYWDEKTIGDILSLEYGKSLDKSERNENGIYNAYGANGVKDKTNKYLYNKKSIIVGRKGSAGELNYTEEKFWALDVCYYVIFDEQKYDIKFLYNLLKLQNLPSLAKGVKPGINRNDVYNLKVNVPKLEEQQKIVSQLDELQEQTKKLEQIYTQKLQDLNELKQSILQKAFNGEL